MRPLRWMSFIILLWTSCCWASPPTAQALDSKLRVAAFNIQVFGQSKLKKDPLITQTLIRIIDRYDLVFVQEIRDIHESAIFQFLDDLNAASRRTYRIATSERLGRTLSKEQYAFLYDEDRVSLIEAQTYNDASDAFEREPYIGEFVAGDLTFSLIGIHVTPRAVKQELTALGQVYRDVKRSHSSENIFIMGDLNADCAYYDDRQGFPYFEDEAILLIPNGVDTTLAPPVCTYDRVLAFGPAIERATQGAAFNFPEAYQIRTDVARDISDHYPVEFTLDIGKGGGDPTDPTPFPPAEEVSSESCGREPLQTAKGYCYAGFGKGRLRVPSHCCQADLTSF